VSQNPAAVDMDGPPISAGHGMLAEHVSPASSTALAAARRAVWFHSLLDMKPESQRPRADKIGAAKPLLTACLP
jgi:hypothetical protein